VRFGLLGAAGYVAPRHMAAMKRLGHELVVACDHHDSVGVLDRYFPKCDYTRHEAEFNHLCREEGVDAVSICTPNHCHVYQAMAALAAGREVICEKPLGLSTEDVRDLERCEAEAGGPRVWTILQLRHHPAVEAAKKAIGEGRNAVEVNYLTRRGPWYHKSWKGDTSKSGGLVFNIGIHLLDILIHLFGASQEVSASGDNLSVEGRLVFERAYVKFLLSTDFRGADPERSIMINDNELDLSAGFEALHVESYRAALRGRGHGIADALPAVQLAEDIVRCL